MFVTLIMNAGVLNHSTLNLERRVSAIKTNHYPEEFNMTTSKFHRAASLCLSLVITFSQFFGVSVVWADSSQNSALGKVNAFLPVDGNLPGGTPISVAINNPVDGAALTGGDISVDGTASIGMGVPVANTALVYVLDVSGSTNNPSLPGCGGDQNSDGRPDSVLDCEILAARTLNFVAESTGTIGEVGGGLFADSGATADVDPASGDQMITGPNTDGDLNGRRDVADVLVSAFSAFGGNGGVNLFTSKTVGVETSFSAGIQAALDILSASSRPNKMVVFMSDGLNSGGVNISSLLPSGGVKFFTFAVGDLANCTESIPLLGNLQDIANLTGGTCTQVSSANIGTLPSILPVVVASQLITLEQSLDGGPFAPILNTEIDPDLPLNGPASVTYNFSLSGLAPGEHTICVRATGSDGGGTGSVTDCHTMNVATLNIRPEAFPNNIWLDGPRLVHVAILSSASLDATNDVDRSSLTFGHSGDENSLHRQGRDCWRNDVNRDGLLDLVCNFVIRRTGFQPSDTIGILKGMLLNGTTFEAQDSVVIVAP